MNLFRFNLEDLENVYNNTLEDLLMSHVKMLDIHFEQQLFNSELPAGISIHRKIEKGGLLDKLEKHSHSGVTLSTLKDVKLIDCGHGITFRYGCEQCFLPRQKLPTFGNVIKVTMVVDASAVWKSIVLADMKSS